MEKIAKVLITDFENYANEEGSLRRLSLQEDQNHELGSNSWNNQNLSRQQAGSSGSSSMAQSVGESESVRRASNWSRRQPSRTCSSGM